MRKPFTTVYRRLLEHHGRQRWWPGDTPFEVMVGAVLTQNTAWTNVEKAIAALKTHRLLNPRRIVSIPPARLAGHLKPVGYFNVKARRLRNFCRWYLDNGGHARLSRWGTGTLRRALLSVNGVGPETADDILLYAFHRDVFVIDAYTRRIFSRLGLADAGLGYEELRRRFETGIKGERGRINGRSAASTSERRALTNLFNEYHALIVNHGKDVCRVRPRCSECCLSKSCPGCEVDPRTAAADVATS